MTLAGREIVFRKPALGQIIMLQRIAVRQIKEARGNEDEDERALLMTSAYVKVLDFIDALMTDPDDRQFVEDQMLAGNIDYRELMKALAGGGNQDSVADDEAPRPVRRAPKKSPKAARGAVPAVASVRAPAKSAVAPRGRAKL